MWYGIVSRRGAEGNYRIRLSGAIHVFTGLHDEGTQQISLCGSVVRKTKCLGSWVDTFYARGIVQVQPSLAPEHLCKRCMQKFKDAEAAERFLETKDGPKDHHRRDGV